MFRVVGTVSLVIGVLILAATLAMVSRWEKRAETDFARNSALDHALAQLGEQGLDYLPEVDRVLADARRAYGPGDRLRLQISAVAARLMRYGADRREVLYFVRARDYYRQALALRAGQPQYEAHYRVHLADTHRQSGRLLQPDPRSRTQYEQALVELQTAAAAARTVGEAELLATVQQELRELQTALAPVAQRGPGAPHR